LYRFNFPYYKVDHFLGGGPLPVAQIKIDADQNGITDKPLRNASMNLNIGKKKNGYSADSYWEWSLPEDALPTRSCPSEKEGIFEEKGHLWREEDSVDSSSFDGSKYR